MAARSGQSRLLRQRLLGRMAAVWAVYSLLFALAAVLANGVLVPRLADWVADSTSNWVAFDMQEIKNAFPYDDLLDSYLQRAYGDEVTREMIDNGEVAVVSDEVPLDNGYYTDVSLSDDGSQVVSLRAVRVHELQEDYLAQQKAEELYEEMRFADPSTADDWVAYPTVGSDDGSFQARNLHTYNQMKAFKWPVAIALYCVGCAVIVILFFGRFLRYFDRLVSAVGSMIHEREKPVDLPRDLFIVEAELNSLRLESLADERAAAAAEQRKNELVAYLAHDIRTPLTSVLGYLSLLRDVPDLPADQRARFTGLALQKAERLEVLVNEFFEITRYNLQSIPIERQRIGLGFFLDQIADEFYPQASAKGVSIEVSAPADTEFFADGDKLARAMGNVVRNAVAYADEGTAVTLEAEALPAEGAGRGGFRLRVTDRGREIAPHHLDSIFEKFYREDTARGAGTGNAGLGLAIAKEILLAHGGTITAESADGLTVFTMDLPASAC